MALMELPPVAPCPHDRFLSVNLGRIFNFGNLAKAREIVASNFPGEIPARLCLQGAMDEGVNIAAVIRAIQNGPVADPEARKARALELIAQAREDHPAADVRAEKAVNSEDSLYKAVMEALSQ